MVVFFLYLHNLFPASDNFYRLLLIFENSSDPDLDPNCLTLW